MSSVDKTEAAPPVADRGTWDNRAEYIMTLLGLSVGLGNVWRFPTLCYFHGGGAFLIPYVLMLTMIGIPMFMLETSMSQFSSSTVLKIYDYCPAMRGVGITCLIMTSIATMYYSVLCAYPLLFIWESLTYDPLPWEGCDHSWNTDRCVDQYRNETDGSGAGFEDYGSGNYGSGSDVDQPRPVFASEEFFYKKILEMTDDPFLTGHLVVPLSVANAIVWILIFLIIFKGVKVIGKVMWFTALFPYVMMLVLLVRSVTLPGAGDGILAYLSPTAAPFTNLRVWAEAASQIFFSLGTGWGSLYCLGSFGKYRTNTVTSALLVPIVNGLTSFVAGFIVFAILGHLAFITGRPVGDVVTTGMSLVFVTYPAGIATLPGAHFWSVCFFLMVFFLGINSCFVQVQTIQISIVDYFNWHETKTLVAAVICGFIYMGSLLMCTQAGLHWLIFLDNVVANESILFIGMMEIIVVAYCYGPNRLMQDIEVMTQRRLSSYWWFSWLVACPLVLTVLFLFRVFESSVNSHGSLYLNITGKVMSWLCILIVPGYWTYYMCTQKGSCNEIFVTAHGPSASWGPAQAEHRREWEEHLRQNPMTVEERYITPPNLRRRPAVGDNFHLAAVSLL